MTAAKQSSLTILTLGTEWNSKHGGLSTFNRYLSRAFERLGHNVICTVEHLDAAEVESAKAANVQLIRSGDVPTALQTAPDIVVGHGRITGPAAHAIAQHYRCRRIHFVHTRAEPCLQIRSVDDKTLLKGDEQRKSEVNLSEDADLVAGVGDVLQRDIETLSGRKVHSFLPGLPTEFNSWEVSKGPPADHHCLLLGRASDVAVKGFDIGAAAFSRVDRSVLSRTPILVIRGVPPSSASSVKQSILGKMESSRAQEPIFRPFTANEDEVAKEIRQSVLVLMPSREEGFGLVGIESIAASVPVLISSRSGLAEYLSGLGCAQNVVVPVTGDFESDVRRWKLDIEFVLRDLDAAFRRAEKLRKQVAHHLSWTRSTRALLEALSEQPKSTAQRIVSSSAARIAAALHLNRHLDSEATARTQQMIKQLATNQPDGGTGTGEEVSEQKPSEMVLVQLLSAHRADADAAAQLEVAITFLRSKYAQMGLAARQIADELRVKWLWTGKSSFSEEERAQLPHLFSLAKMIAADVDAIPNEAMQYASVQGLSLHAAVRTGSAIETVQSARYLFEKRGRDPDTYAMENLMRLFDAAAQLSALDPQQMVRGYVQAGHIDREGVRNANTLIIVAQSVNNQMPGISVLAETGRAPIMEVARLHARRQSIQDARIENRKIIARSAQYVYRWSLESTTPEVEWQTPSGRLITIWHTNSKDSKSELFIESDDGEGIGFRERDEIARWRRPAGDPIAIWIDGQGRLCRAYVMANAEIVVCSESENRPLCPPLAFRATLFPMFSSLLRVQDYPFGISGASQFELGTLQGRRCLVSTCLLDPGALAVFFIDAETLKILRPPLVTRLFFEEFQLVDVGGRSLLVATLMPRSGSTVAIWDVTTGAGGEEPPLALAGNNMAGWALNCVPSAESLDVWFSTRTRGDGQPAQQLWRWHWPSQKLTLVAKLSDGLVGSIAVQ